CANTATHLTCKTKQQSSSCSKQRCFAPNGRHSCYCRRNESPLHFGQRSATAAVTGRVKCFTCPQAVHFQPSDRNSVSLGKRSNARCASPLIFSRRSRRWLVVWAIDLAPIGADDDGVCVFGC